MMSSTATTASVGIASDGQQHHKMTIAPMDQSSIQRMVAGQAVTDMASAVKELVDNALDAGAKSINIRLFNQGLDLIEVSDDGCGVPMESRPFLAQKHATSKIRCFEDIYSTTSSGSARTLGFRGEALFCLANLSGNLVVCTRTANDRVAQKMDFGRDGMLRPDTVSVLPRKVGTTVAIVQLFAALPVRRADLIKRLSAQRTKLFHLMQGYAVLCQGVRFHLMDIHTATKREEIKLRSAPTVHSTLEQTVSAVLGSKLLKTLQRITIDLKEVLSDDSADWKVEGLISKLPSATTTTLSSASSVQFFSINGRPVELPKVSRAIGEIWRDTNRADGGIRTKATVVFQFHLPLNSFDVNLSPDKREALLTHQTGICEAIQDALRDLWVSQQGTFTVVPSQQIPTEAQTTKSLVQSSRVSNSTTREMTNSSSSSAALHLQRNGVSPRRARRRMAFVNDFRSIKLQHEMDDEEEEDARRRQRRDSSSGTATGHAITPPVQDDDDEDGYRPNDQELREWNRVRQQFHRRSPDAAQMEDEDDDDEDDDDEDDDTAEPERPPTSLPSSKRMRRQSVAPSSSSPAAALVTPTEGRPSMKVTLQDFAFQPLGRRASMLPARHRQQQGNEQNKESSSRVVSFSQVSQKDGGSSTSKGAAAGVSFSQDEEEDDVMMTSDSTAKTANTRLVKMKNPYASRSSSSKRTSEPLKAERFAKRQRRMSTVREVVEASATESCEEDDDDDEDDEEMDTQNDADGAIRGNEKPVIVWKDFPGTEGVLQAIIAARVAQVRRHRELRRLARRSSTLTTQSSDGIMQEDEDHPDMELNSSSASAPRSRASNSNGNGAPEDSSLVQLQKEDFEDMVVIGQFNSGFILAMCQRDRHLWILDQHACDEKYQFEKLCRETQLKEQRLIQPMLLTDLSPAEESCILENMHVFQANGFRFRYEADRPPRQRMYLIGVPHSGARDGCKSVQFDASDVTALCAILGASPPAMEESSCDGGEIMNGAGTGADGSGSYGNNAVRRYAGSQASSVPLSLNSQESKFSRTSQGDDLATTNSSQGSDGDNNKKNIMARLPKAIAMLANRACRGSVWIGQSLSRKEMEGIVRRLQHLDHPWNCPHGRPTMRHVHHMIPDLWADERRMTRLVEEPTVSTSSSSSSP